MRVLLRSHSQHTWELQRPQPPRASCCPAPAQAVQQTWHGASCACSSLYKSLTAAGVSALPLPPALPTASSCRAQTWDKLVFPSLSGWAFSSHRSCRPCRL